MKSKFNYIAAFWLVQLSLAIIKIIFTLRPEINLFTEEAQYWLWSKNLAWHYYSKPPLIAAVNYISTSILGDTEIAVRINAILFGLGTAWVVFKFTEFLFHSRKMAFWASLILSAMPFWMLFSTFHMTDSELTFFWILSWYLLARALVEKRTRWWILAGVSAAFGLMSKSIMVVIVPILAIYLLFTSNFSTNRKGFAFFLILFSTGFLPSLIWNWQNGFSTFRHLATLGGVSGGSSGIDLGESLWGLLSYLGGQLAMISVFFLPFLLLSLKVLFHRSGVKLGFLFVPVLFTFFLFAGLSLFTSVEANWPAYAYPSLAIIFAYVLEREYKDWQKVKSTMVALSFAIPLVLFLPDVASWKSKVYLDQAEKVAFRRLSGYKDLAGRILYLKDSLQVEEAYYFSESYHMASELAFYLPEVPQVYVAGMGSRKNQFDLWKSLDQEIGLERTGMFVSWNESSPENVAQFGELIYEETYLVYFKGKQLRTATIQVWRDLRYYQAIQTDRY